MPGQEKQFASKGGLIEFCVCAIPAFDSLVTVMGPHCKENVIQSDSSVDIVSIAPTQGER